VKWFSIAQDNGKWWGLEMTVIYFIKENKYFVASLEDLNSMESVYSIY
jgi:hypothetical protein